MPLYNSEDNPLWLIHKVPCVDIAVINISKGVISRIVSHSAKQEGLKGTIDILCINDHQFHDNMLIEVADDVFVIGYPFGKGGLEIPILPVWKRASIASEPSLSYYTDGRDCFLIDTTTRSGMSGSPVIAYKTGAFRTTDSERLSVVPNGFASKLLGVYSGRIDGYSKDDSFVGVIWKEKLINEIIDSNNFDKLDNLLYKNKL